MISFSQTGGTSGITQITISATSTQELADIVSHYTLGNESTSLDMPVVQKAYVPVQKYITMSPSAITWSSSNNTGSITINSNDSWVVVSDGWIQVSRMYESDISERYNSVSGNGNTIIGISCFENIGDARSGGITAYCQSDSAISATTTVSQAGGYVKPYITLGTYSMQVSGGSVTTAVTVQSNTTWSAITDSRWITINTLSGSGNGNVSFVVDANSSNIERRATITVFNGEINAVLVLTQAASVSRPYIILSPNSFSVPYEGSTGNTISVSANCDYDIDADVPWITVNAVSGSGNGSVSFSTSAMTGSSVGNIVFSNSAVTEYATVETAFIPYLSANTNNISSSSTGGTFEVSVYSNVNWSVSVDMGEGRIDTPWLSVIPSSGSNDGSIRISVASGMAARSGSVYISNSTYGLSWTISVEEAEPTYTDRIYYTSTGGTVVNPSLAYGNFGANIVSNTYSDGVGVILFDGEVTNIPGGAFNGMAELDSLVIPNSVSEIGSYALYNTSIESFVIPDSVLSAWQYSVASSALTELTIGKNCTMVRNGTYNWAFLEETLETLYVRTEHIPSNFIGGGGYGSIRPLSGCTVILEDTVKTIGNGAFSLCGIDELVIINTDNLESIGDNAFSENILNPLVIRLPYTTVPNPNLGIGSFYGCTGITELDLQVSVVPRIAFRDCTSLRKLTLRPTTDSQYSTVNFGDMAFYNCESLSEIYSYCPYCPQGAIGAFSYVSDTGTLHYPSGANYAGMINALPSGWTAVDDIVPTGDYLTVSPSSFTVDATGSTGNQISIVSNLSYNISSNVNWITLSDISGTGNKTISFSTSSTTSTSQTNGTITISDGTLTKTVSVTREAYIPPQPQIPNNEIHYTTTGGTVLAPYTTNGWGSTILDNTYNDGQGILEFGGNVTAFPYNAYSNKKELQTIEMPNSVTVISGQSFIYCSKLQEVTIGSGVTSILNYAFYSCSSLATIYAHPTTAPTLGTGVFGVASSGTLHYPSGSDYSTWISALPSGWTAVADL